MENPQHAIMEPICMNNGELENKFVVNAAAGEEHTIVVAQVRRDN